MRVTKLWLPPQTNVIVALVIQAIHVLIICMIDGNDFLWEVNTLLNPLSWLYSAISGARAPHPLSLIVLLFWFLGWVGCIALLVLWKGFGILLQVLVFGGIYCSAVLVFIRRIDYFALLFLFEKCCVLCSSCFMRWERVIVLLLK